MLSLDSLLYNVASFNSFQKQHILWWQMQENYTNSTLDLSLNFGSFKKVFLGFLSSCSMSKISCYRALYQEQCGQ